MRIHDNIISGSPEESDPLFSIPPRIHVHHVPRFFFPLPSATPARVPTNLLKGMTWKIQFPEKNEKILFRLDFNFPLSLSFSPSLFEATRSFDFTSRFALSTNHFLDIYCCDSAVRFWRTIQFYFDKE